MLPGPGAHRRQGRDFGCAAISLPAAQRPRVRDFPQLFALCCSRGEAAAGTPRSLSLLGTAGTGLSLRVFQARGSCEVEA